MREKTRSLSFSSSLSSLVFFLSHSFLLSFSISLWNLCKVCLKSKLRWLNQRAILGAKTTGSCWSSSPILYFFSSILFLLFFLSFSLSLSVRAEKCAKPSCNVFTIENLNLLSPFRYLMTFLHWLHMSEWFISMFSIKVHYYCIIEVFKFWNVSKSGFEKRRPSQTASTSDVSPTASALPLKQKDSKHFFSFLFSDRVDFLAIVLFMYFSLKSFRQKRCSSRLSFFYFWAFWLFPAPQKPVPRETPVLGSTHIWAKPSTRDAPFDFADAFRRLLHPLSRKIKYINSKKKKARVTATPQKTF